MTTPTGDITVGQVAAELGIGLPLTLGDSRVRALAGVASGPISLGQLRGKSAYTPPSVSVDTASINVFEYVQNDMNGYASGSLTLTIQGGEAPFTVAWARLSGVNQINVAGTTNPTFAASQTAPWNYQAIFRATVTDKRGATAYSPDISVQLAAGSTIT